MVSALFEGWSFAVGFREYKRVIRGRDIPLWSFIKASKDPSLYGTLLEDFSAIIGIAIAALGVIASSLLHIGWADGAASIAIGLLLFGVSAVLANETRSLIAGEAVAGPIMEELHRVLAADSRILQIDEIATMHLGPQAILMALTLRFRSELSIPALDDAIREITFALQAVEKRVAYVYVRPGPNGALPLGQTRPTPRLLLKASLSRIIGRVANPLLGGVEDRNSFEHPNPQDSTQLTSGADAEFSAHAESAA
jgi:hypothetical protein